MIATSDHQNFNRGAEHLPGLSQAVLILTQIEEAMKVATHVNTKMKLVKTSTAFCIMWVSWFVYTTASPHIVDAHAPAIPPK